MAASPHTPFSASHRESQMLRCIGELRRENEVLLRELGSIQRRVTAAVHAQARENEALEALVVRLRGELIARDTTIAMLRERLERQDSKKRGAAFARWSLAPRHVLQSHLR